MINKFTSSPWVKDYGGSVGHIKSVWSGHRLWLGKPITPTVCRYDSSILPEWEANGHLLKAAPRLLEALEYVRNSLVDPIEQRIVDEVIAEAYGENDGI